MLSGVRVAKRPYSPIALAIDTALGTDGTREGKRMDVTVGVRVQIHRYAGMLMAADH